VRISPLAKDGGSCFGDQFIRLYNNQSSQVGYDGDSGGSNCALLIYSPIVGSGCRSYTLQQGCYSSTSCGGTFSVVQRNVTGNFTASPSKFPTKIPTKGPTKSPVVLSRATSKITAALKSNPSESALTKATPVIIAAAAGLGVIALQMGLYFGLQSAKEKKVEDKPYNQAKKGEF